MNFKKVIILGGFLAFCASCSSNSGSGSSSSTATEVADGVGLIATSVGVIGSSLGGAGAAAFYKGSVSAMATTAFESSRCNEHGSPLTSGGASLDQTDETYPYLHTYCAFTVSDGETVKGGFSLVQGLICSLEKGGIQFAGEAQSITVTFSDTDCWPSGGPDPSLTSVTISATGSSPASFNSHFEKGVIFTVADLGLTYKVAANLTDDKVEFIANELWSGAAAGTSAGNKGSMAGELSKTTGVLRFETRDERVRSDCTTNSCGWNRHTRIHATLAMSGGSPTDLVSFSYGYSNINIPAATLDDPAEAGGNAYLISAKGALETEIKARLFKTNSGRTLAQLQDKTQYTETANTACASSAGIDDAADCGTETGVALFSVSPQFTLVSGGGHTTPENWLANFTGFNFTVVNLDTDEAF